MDNVYSDTILKYVVTNARKELSEDKDIKNDSLAGCCGFTQMIDLLPFIDMGLPVTINNACTLPNSSCKHAFGTVQLPILEGDKVVQKRYLIDI